MKTVESISKNRLFIDLPIDSTSTDATIRYLGKFKNSANYKLRKFNRKSLITCIQRAPEFSENSILNNNKDVEIFELWKKFSVFSMENASTISPRCASAVKHFIEGVKQNEIASVKMFDATGKLPSGLLRGNVNQFGDFDECMSVQSARYCLAEIDLEPSWTLPYTQYKNLIHSHYAIRETFDDVKHRVPGFSMVRWGFCIPRECSSTDLEKALQENVGISSRIKPTMCQVPEEAMKDTNSNGGKISKAIFALIIFITLVATIGGLYPEKTFLMQARLKKYLDCFDLQRNWESLKTVRTSDQEVESIHGIRALSALALLISHKTMALFYNPYMNRAVMAANLGMRWSVIGRTAILYTDCFMLISGFLNATALFKELEKGRNMKFGEKFISRVFRITPNIAAVILFCTYILPSLNSGPLWPLVVGHHSHLCKKHMWRNMLYIHNYFPFQDMCLTHTHQVGIDMQLFLVTPLVVYILWSSRKIGLGLIAFITIASTVLRFVVTWNNNLSHVVHFGITITRMFDTANLSYILPTHRATIYFMGVYLAYILRNKSEIALSKVQLTILWSIFMSFGFGTWLGPMHMSHTGYLYNKIDAAFYGAFSPILWGGAVAWTIYATEKGCGGFFGAILSWSKFRYFTKIAYAVYLVQFPLFFYNVGRTKHIDEFSPYHMLQIPETMAVILISIGLTIFVEIPFQNLRKTLLRKESGKQKISKKVQHDVNQNDALYIEKVK